MKSTTDTTTFTATDMRIALSEIHPDSTYGAVPVIDQYTALAMYRAVDDDTLSEVPEAFAAYLDHQRNEWS